MEPERITSPGRALVVGGGIGGMATAISLAARGVAVELVDIDPDWRVYGAGITAYSATMIYMWMLTPHQRRERHFTEAELYNRLKALLADFGGHAGWIRDTMTRDDWINYRPLAAALQPRAWRWQAASC